MTPPFEFFDGAVRALVEASRLLVIAKPGDDPQTILYRLKRFYIKEGLKHYPDRIA